MLCRRASPHNLGTARPWPRRQHAQRDPFPRWSASATVPASPAPHRSGRFSTITRRNCPPFTRRLLPPSPPSSTAATCTPGSRASIGRPSRRLRPGRPVCLRRPGRRAGISLKTHSLTVSGQRFVSSHRERCDRRPNIRLRRIKTGRFFEFPASELLRTALPSAGW